MMRKSTLFKFSSPLLRWMPSVWRKMGMSMICCCFCVIICAQPDSVLDQMKQVPLKYISAVDHKVKKYQQLVSARTIKTFERLSRWESKVQKFIQRSNPALAQELFGAHQQTFNTILQRIQQGQTAITNGSPVYDGYRDNLSTSLQYLSINKGFVDSNQLSKLAATTKKLGELSGKLDETGALESFIKDRKKLLADQCLHFIGNSKYLQKINKEAWYYVQALQNYQSIFNTPGNLETTVNDVLNRIPAFRAFVQKHSMRGAIFDSYTSALTNLPGLQSSNAVQKLVQQRIGITGTAGISQVQQNIQAGQATLSKIATNLANTLHINTSEDLPDFKPNMEKTKTFYQRLEIGMNVQYARTNIIPTTMDIAFSIGYKLNERSIAGIGSSYRLGIGTVRQVQISHQGVSLRSFIDWKIRNKVFLSGGYEMNYLPKPRDAVIDQRIQIPNGWQPSTLLGLSKKFKIKTRLFSETKLQVLYDFLDNRRPLVFRIGYNL